MRRVVKRTTLLTILILVGYVGAGVPACVLPCINGVLPSFECSYAGLEVHVDGSYVYLRAFFIGCSSIHEIENTTCFRTESVHTP